MIASLPPNYNEIVRSIEGSEEKSTEESRPNVKSIRKKKIDQTGAQGIVAIASG